MYIKFCSKSFKRPQDLKKHEKIHSEQHISTLRCHQRPSRQQAQPHCLHHPLTPPNSTSHSSRDVSPILSSHNPISPPTSTYSDDNWMYSGVSSSSDISSAQRAHPFVTQTKENSFHPNDLINDLLFPMDIDQVKPTEYNLGKLSLSFYI